MRHCTQWRRNEFESGGHLSGAKVGASILREASEKIFLVVPLHLSYFPSCFGAGVINLNEPPSSFLLPLRYWGLGAGSIPLRAIVNKKQC